MNAAFRTARRVADQIEAAHIMGVELGQIEEAQQIIAQTCREAHQSLCGLDESLCVAQS